MPESTCVVDGCDHAAAKVGHCHGHYRRLRVHGDVQAHIPIQAQRHRPRSSYTPSDPTLTREERLTASLHARVRAGLVESHETWNGTPHLLWTGATVKGYGAVYDTLRGNNARVHRVAWEMARGPIPDGLTIDHLCRTTLCAAVEHLEPVTIGENVRRADPGARQRAKTHCPRGHEYNEANTRTSAKGLRQCRVCQREDARARTVAGRQRGV